MPIKIDDQLPAHHSLELENIFVMTNDRASKQDIRPLKIIILIVFICLLFILFYCILLYLILLVYFATNAMI